MLSFFFDVPTSVLLFLFACAGAPFILATLPLLVANTLPENEQRRYGELSLAQRCTLSCILALFLAYPTFWLASTILSSVITSWSFGLAVLLQISLLSYRQTRKSALEAIGYLPCAFLFERYARFAELNFDSHDFRLPLPSKRREVDFERNVNVSDCSSLSFSTFETSKDKKEE